MKLLSITAAVLVLAACNAPPKEMASNATNVDENVTTIDMNNTMNVDENLTTVAMTSSVGAIRGVTTDTDEIPAEEAVKIDDWSWEADPDFGTEGAIKWRVSILNVSDRPIESAEVQFSAYDEDHHLLTTTSGFVEDIPPGATRDDEHFADYHGGNRPRAS